MCLEKIISQNPVQRGFSEQNAVSSSGLERGLVDRITALFWQNFSEIINFFSRGLQLVTRKIVSVSITSITRLILPERPYTNRMCAVRLALNEETHNAYWSEACRAFASYLTRYLVLTLDHAEKLPEAVKPSWLHPFVEGDAFTLTGQIARDVIHTHQELLFQTLYVNFLQIALHVTSEIRQMKEKDPFLVRDLAKVLLLKIHNHFHAMVHEGVFLETLDNEPTELSKIILKFLFQNQEKDLELPFFKTFLQDIIWYEIQHALPDILRSLFSTLSDPETKEKFLLQAFLQLRAFVDVEHAAPSPNPNRNPSRNSFAASNPQTPNPQTENLVIDREFVEVTGKAMDSFFTYIDAEFFDELFLPVSPEMIHEAVGHNAQAVLNSLDIMEELHLLPYKFLSQALPGKWETDAEKFILQPLSLIKTLDEKAASVSFQEEARKQVRKRLEALVQEIGSQGDGLHSLANEQIKGKAPHKIHRKKHFFDRLKALIKKPFHAMEKQVKRNVASIVIAYLCREIHNLSQETFVKMQDKRHTALFCAIPRESIRFIANKSRNYTNRE